MDIKNIFARKKVATPDEYKTARMYDYSTEDARIATAEWLFEQARNERKNKETEWQRMEDYYVGEHDVAKQMRLVAEDMGLDFIPSVVPDPYIMVESQINPDVPMPEFHGRDNSGDQTKAQLRQKAVKYVMENNRINDMNTANERRLRKYGDAWWKAWWDADMPCGEELGDIRLKDIPIQDIYVDPIAYRLEECEYIDYVYTMHKMKFWRVWGEELKRQGKTLDDVTDQQYRKDDHLLENHIRSTRATDDLVQIMEHWFRQPTDGKGFVAGDIACTIQAGGIELRYIPCYWERTHMQNKNFPFVHYWCIGDETGFYNRSEIEPIIDMVDAADRELATSLLNDAMMANDVMVVEDGALVEGQEPSNQPGTIINVRQGRMNGVKRLGGLYSGMKCGDTIAWLQNQMQRANRNYDTNNGQESARITTASGLLQLRSDAAAQGELKKADRNKGFCRLYELIDWLCLEFYTDFRMLYIGVDDATGEPETIEYNSEMFEEPLTPVYDMETGMAIPNDDKYFPRMDVNVTCGDGIGKNPASTVQILDRIAAVNVTADNWELLAAELEYLDIPQKQDIVDRWKKKFATGIPEGVITALQNNPDLLNAVTQMATQMPQQTAAKAPATAQIGTADIVDDGMNVPKY